MKGIDAEEPVLDENCRFHPEINKKSASISSKNTTSKISRTEQLYLLDQRKREEKKRKSEEEQKRREEEELKEVQKIPKINNAPVRRKEVERPQTGRSIPKTPEPDCSLYERAKISQKLKEEKIQKEKIE